MPRHCSWLNIWTLPLKALVPHLGERTPTRVNKAARWSFTWTVQGQRSDWPIGTIHVKTEVVRKHRPRLLVTTTENINKTDSGSLEQTRCVCVFKCVCEIRYEGNHTVFQETWVPSILQEVTSSRETWWILLPWIIHYYTVHTSTRLRFTVTQAVRLVFILADIFLCALL